MPGTQIAAGNFLLCFAILMAGGSAIKMAKHSYPYLPAHGIRMCILAFILPIPESK